MLQRVEDIEVEVATGRDVKVGTGEDEVSGVDSFEDKHHKECDWPIVIG